MSSTSDHFPCLFSIPLNNVDNDDVYVKVKYRNKCSINNENFKWDLHNCDWTGIMSTKDIELLCNRFDEKIQKIYNDNYPIKINRIKRLDVIKPYIGNELNVLIKEKHRMQRLYYKWPITYGEEFKRIRNDLNKKTEIC